MEQGGRKAGYRVAQQHSLTPQVLEMLAEMRQQFASMLADSRLVPESLRGPRDSRRRKEALVMPAWLDGPEHSWNSHAKDPSVVRLGPKGHASDHMWTDLHRRIAKVTLCMRNSIIES